MKTNLDSEIIDFISLKDREFYDYYKKNRKSPSLGVYQFSQFEKVVGGLMMSLRKLILEKEGGVFIEGLGYFAVFRTHKKTRKKNSYSNTLQSLLPQYRWYPVFFGDIGSPTFRHWTMSKAFVPELNRLIKERISKGKKYKLYYSLLKNIASASRETRKIKKLKT